jgi:hypothetical protein
MAELMATSRCLPCPICADVAGKCRIDEYRYIALCYLRLDAKAGDLIKTWLCKRVDNECSQWKDQRVALEARYRERKIRLVDENGQPLDLSAAFDKLLEEHRSEQGGLG